jgi:hypothetical protein
MSNSLVIAETRTCNKSQGRSTIIIGPSPARRQPPSLLPGPLSPPLRSPSPLGLPPSTTPPRLEQERVQEQEQGENKVQFGHLGTRKFDTPGLHRE